MVILVQFVEVLLETAHIYHLEKPTFVDARVMLYKNQVSITRKSLRLEATGAGVVRKGVLSLLLLFQI